MTPTELDATENGEWPYADVKELVEIYHKWANWHIDPDDFCGRIVAELERRIAAARRPVDFVCPKCGTNLRAEADSVK